MNKLYENTNYYLVKLQSTWSNQIKVEPIKIIYHSGNGNTSRKQYITFLYKNKIYTSILKFYDREQELKQQNQHIFKTSERIALCLTITDCKTFIRQFFKQFYVNAWKSAWIPKGQAQLTKLHYKETLREFYNIINNLQA